MSFDYIRSTYGVPAKRGMAVRWRGVWGRITSASNYVHILFPGYSRPLKVHPTDEQLHYGQDQMAQANALLRKELAIHKELHLCRSKRAAKQKADDDSWLETEA